MGIDLKPCPFCGGDGTLVNRTFWQSPPYTVECRNCSFDIWPHESAQAAAEFWNTRNEAAKKAEQHIVQTKPLPDAVLTYSVSGNDQPVGCREAFEAFVSNPPLYHQKLPIERAAAPVDPDEYVDYRTNLAWQHWKAASERSPVRESSDVGYEYAVEKNAAIAEENLKLRELLAHCPRDNWADWLHRKVDAALSKPIIPAIKSSGWQPIETAPKDGTDILVFHKMYYRGRPKISHWKEHSFDVASAPQPTHWQPCPSTEALYEIEGGES